MDLNLQWFSQHLVEHMQWTIQTMQEVNRKSRLYLICGGACSSYKHEPLSKDFYYLFPTAWWYIVTQSKENRCWRKLLIILSHAHHDFWTETLLLNHLLKIFYWQNAIYFHRMSPKAEFCTAYVFSTEWLTPKYRCVIQTIENTKQKIP